jgi:uncharacterized cupredoxin-like copper-binding protein
MTRRLRLIAVLGVMSVVAIGCGGSDGGDGEPSGDGVVVEMEDFSLDAAPGTHAAGPVAFEIRNGGPSVHALTVIRSDAAADALPVENGLIPEGQVDVVDEETDIPPGADATLSTNLEAGSYILVCNLPAHYESGMYAAFTVE